MDESTLWRTIVGIIGTLVGVIWLDNKQTMKAVKKDTELNTQRINALRSETYTKPETDLIVKLHVDPINETQTRMWDDIREIKQILMEKRNG